MRVAALGTYRPPWRNPAGQAVAGPDEDATTLAVAAAGSLLHGLVAVESVARVVLVTRIPALLEGPTAAVIATALGLAGDVPVEVHLGGGPAVLDVLVGAAPGALVIGVDPEAPAAAAAAFVGRSGAGLDRTARADGRLPSRVRAPGEAARVCDDPRLLRDLGWRRAVGGNHSPASAGAVVVGPPAAVAAALGGDRAVAEAVSAQGASAPLLALAEFAGSGRDGVLMALEGDSVTAVTVSDAASLSVVRDEAPPLPGTPPATDVSGASPIPASAAAYARAFDAKVGFAGGRCECGVLDLPPRYRCLVCGREEAWELERLPRTGTVYTGVTIHAPVPGRATPYSLVIVDVGDSGVRYLAPVTGARPGSVTIGDAGRLVLRRLADREVGPDYGFAFLPTPEPAAVTA